MHIDSVIMLIRQWPSQTAMANDLGVERHIVKDWRAGKAMIRAEYFNAIVDAARARGIKGVTLSLLADLAEAGGEL